MASTREEMALERVLDEIRFLSPYEAAEVLKQALETAEEAAKQYDRALGYN